LGIDHNFIMALLRRASPNATVNKFAVYFTVSLRAAGITTGKFNLDVDGGTYIRDLMDCARSKYPNNAVDRVIYNGYKVPSGLTMAQVRVRSSAEKEKH
jgi:hypothetical protein